MKTPYKYIPFLCLGAVIGGCSDDNMRLPSEESGEQLPITLSAAYPTATRASDAGFEDGDNMGVYVLDYSGDIAEEITSDDIHAKNVKYSFNASDNSWTGTTTLYWSSNTTPADIIGYYPFISTINDETAVPFSVARRQDVADNTSQLGGYEGSDFLWAKAEKVMPTTSRVDLTCQHLMAGVRVTLAEGTGFSSGEWSSLDKQVLVSNVCPDAEVNLANGEVTVKSGSVISITPYKYNEDWRAVVVPQTIKANTNLISVSVDGVSYNLVKDTDFTYQSGKMHPFTITVNKRSAQGDYEFVLTDEAIIAWIDDVDFRDGLMRQYVTVNVDTAGTLAECIKKAGLNPATITALKVKGELSSADFGYIRENCEMLSAINLKETVTYGREDENNEKYVLPGQAFYELSTLTHVIFPEKIKKIGAQAFMGTNLMGSLVLPEGLEVLDYGVFNYCGNLMGTLTLPSTLRVIGGGAFTGAGLGGDLLLPPNLEAIGGDAFAGCNFTGELILPDSLKEIYEAAFAGLHFTGNLVLPQGLKVLLDRAFVGCTFTGYLTLPEGMVEIPSQAFLGCGFRGELKLPSTIRRLGSNAFEDNKFSKIIFPKNMNYIGSGCFKGNNRLSGTLTIPEGISAINYSTFADCNLLDEVIIGEDITKIEGDAFGRCYNLSSIVCNNPEPPVLTIYRFDGEYEAFNGIPKDNFTLQVPEKSVALYSQAKGWKEFKRISAYSNFVCRPATACALTNSHQETLVINSDGDWEVTHIPDWCSLSRTSGSGKTELNLTIKDMSKGSGNRSDYIEFSLKGTDFTTKCDVSQYDYQYAEDECITLQKATRGNGVNILFLGDGFDGEAISKGEYLELVNEQMEAFFGVEPYTTYRDYFNVYACISLSQETGVNTVNTWRNTRFQTLFTHSCSGTGNLMLDDIDAVFDYAVANSPLTGERMSQSVVILTLNSDEYGGSTSLTWNGSAVSICSRSTDPYPSDTRGIVQHEACGHAFGKLAEEKIAHNRYLTPGEGQTINEMHEKG
ncbi:MAG: leucine-rich repeat protein, partial [Muribaculaceae bacterium]|nr:leucine-rich repeat protein [Muribaculaceae bacterium]